MSQGRILALDLGDKRIGLAISDPLGFTAQPLATYERRNRDLDVKFLNELCREKSVQKCIVGLPLQMTGETGDQAKKVLAWVEMIRAQIPHPVETWDERLTTREATRLMIEQGLSRRKRNQKNDALAAVLLLQNYLEARRDNSSSKPASESSDDL